MTWTNRLRLWGGMLAVVLLVGLLAVLFNQRQHQAPSVAAHVDAPTSAVGSDYGGVVTESFVKEGDRVTAGQPLFTLSSLSLQQDLANGLKPAPTQAYDIDAATGSITYLAVMDGYVADITATEGSFLGNGQQMALVVADGERSVVATYELDPVDYGRIERGARVEILLPDNQQVSGTVSNARVEHEGGRTVTEVRVASSELMDPSLESLTRLGTPVLAVMQLKDEGPLAGPTSSMLAFLTKVGLR